MIELAPNHKMGLPVANPILLAGGIIGCGEAVPPGLELSRLGAVVVGPVMATGSPGAPLPRLAHTQGGCVLEAGSQNRGVGAVLRRFASLWPSLGVPVVLQLADREPRLLARTVARVESVPGLAGLELVLPGDGDLAQARSLVRRATRETELPLWVKLPLPQAEAWAEAAVEAGAAGLVVGQPPTGALMRPWRGEPVPVRGSLYGPLAFGLMLEKLLAVAELALPCALIACGGIHTWEQVQQALAAGAQAVQIDVATWVEPALPGQLAQTWAGSKPMGE
ncbi:hypothetical protein FKZ61_004400 [Litorilinea aerophila]|uniref:Dihydroorotate dehydrogenase catalytic domain-containing protein n=1 Tax=Litorilinea aerophila TaxID=1204385 RepID=A0A540VKH3_9CHLR|nr:hypothetical protein [Litorilinea aerophila]MCC9075350.1 hypothetical protein [Litorilinea aerophila]